MYCAIRYALWGLAEIYRLEGWESGKGGGVEDFGCVTINLLDPHKKIRDIIFICPKWQLIGSEFSIVLFCRLSPPRDTVMNDSLVSMRSFPC